MPRNYKTDLFQKRHYEWLAETIKNLDLQEDVFLIDPQTTKALRVRIAMEFANALKGSNPGYDKQRFLDACQPTED